MVKVILTKLVRLRAILEPLKVNQGQPIRVVFEGKPYYRVGNCRVSNCRVGNCRVGNCRVSNCRVGNYRVSNCHADNCPHDNCSPGYDQLVTLSSHTLVGMTSNQS